MTDKLDDGGSPAPGKSPVNFPGNSVSGNFGVDLYSQAVKTLSERSPFDSAEVLVNTSASLPSRLSRLLVKEFDSHRKRKKQVTDSKTSSEKSKKSNIWVELEGYFRELTLKDIERLYRLSLTFLSVESSNSCFNIPGLGNLIRNYDNGNINYLDCVHAGDVIALVENVVEEENEGAENDRVLGSIAVEVTGQKVEKKIGKHHVKLEDMGHNGTCLIEKGFVPATSTQPCSSMEWVLGSRDRVLTTITRPTKKRKILSENPGLERLLVAQPYEGSSSLCHVCSIGDTGDQLNKLVVCKSCKVVVHQKCYGIQGDVDESWMCSWCKHKNFVEAGHPSSSDRPCVLCPNSGGALKRFIRADCESSVEFAHLFCAQWIPEVHIGDTRMMEPLVCVKGINDLRETLICVLCNLKLGSCVQCSDGSCRAPFHPTCAREAGNKLEIWGKFGCDDIELRAFCNKHSGDTSVTRGTLEKNELGDVVGSYELASSAQQGNKIKKRRISRKNGDGVTPSVGTVDTITKSSEEHMPQNMTLKGVMSKTEQKLGSGGLQVISEVETAGQELFQDKAPYLDLGVVLKKLLDRGKVSLQQIAYEIGIAEDYLATKLSGNLLGPEMSCKILKWVRDHAFLGTHDKDLTTKARCLLHAKAEFGIDNHSDAVAMMDLDMPDVVPVKSVPPRRRTIGHIVKEDKVMLLRNDKLLGNDVINRGTDQEQENGNHDHLSTDAILDSMEKIMVKTNGSVHPLREPSLASESNLLKSSIPSGIECNGAEELFSFAKSVLDFDPGVPSCPISTLGYNDGDVKPEADSFVHPYIQKKLEQVQCLLAQKAHPECNGCTKIESSVTNWSPITNNNGDDGYESCGVKLEDLRTDKKMRILNLSPEDEVEGEIIFSQQWLLHNAVVLKRCADQLVCKVVSSLPCEIDAVRKQRWDDVFVNQYINELKEARKQTRKERRCKEAQAVLAAATEAAAASTRVSSLRKDAADESLQKESPLKVECSRIGDRLPPHSVPPPKELNTSSDFPEENTKSCDICRRVESSLNPILLCLGCKVAVHLNCYRGVREFAGPWYCELCEESSLFKASRNTIKKPHPVAECALCGASNGAFRKSSNGQWVHAFCAEWVFGSTFRRGQAFPVAGMETLLKDNVLCSVCHRKFGACIKCNYGKCQGTFHPLCARSAGYYMNTKSVGEKIQHKAYCSKHSSEQRVKAESQKRNVEDLKIIKQHRVELEKLRLLCERIVKREKLKRELVLCNYGILASRRDSLAVSKLVQRPFWVHEGSPESAATSLRGHSWSCSEVIQKSDDVTIDSALSSKRCIRPPLSIDYDQKTDDSSISQRIATPKPTKISLFAEKQIPIRAKGDQSEISTE